MSEECFKTQVKQRHEFYKPHLKGDHNLHTFTHLQKERSSSPYFPSYLNLPDRSNVSHGETSWMGKQSPCDPLTAAAPAWLEVLAVAPCSLCHGERRPVDGGHWAHTWSLSQSKASWPCCWRGPRSQLPAQGPDPGHKRAISAGRTVRGKGTEIWASLTAWAARLRRQMTTGGGTGNALIWQESI